MLHAVGSRPCRGQIRAADSPHYVWEHKGRIDVSVAARQKTFFLLKLFRRHGAEGSGGPGDAGSAPGGSGGGGGSGTGGAPGAPPPQ